MMLKPGKAVNRAVTRMYYESVAPMLYAHFVYNSSASIDLPASVFPEP
jgi:hypothetical protein